MINVFRSHRISRDLVELVCVLCFAHKNKENQTVDELEAEKRESAGLYIL